MTEHQIRRFNGNTSVIRKDGTTEPQCQHYVTFKTTDEVSMRDGKLWVNGEEYVFKTINPLDILFFYNWHSLAEGQKQKLISQVWVYDAESEIWHPQTAPYA